MLYFLRVSITIGCTLNVLAQGDVIPSVDFQKAFNSVPHQRLLQKLSSFGIHGNLLWWRKGFFIK